MLKGIWPVQNCTTLSCFLFRCSFRNSLTFGFIFIPSQAIRKLHNLPSSQSITSDHDSFKHGLRAWLDTVTNLAAQQEQALHNLNSLDENASLAGTLRDMLEYVVGESRERNFVESEQLQLSCHASC